MIGKGIKEDMDWEKPKRLLWKLAIFYWVMVIMIYAIAHEQFQYQPLATSAYTPAFHIGEITDGVEVRQRVVSPTDRLDAIQLMAGTFGRENSGLMRLALLDETGAEVARGSIPVAGLVESQFVSVPLEQPLENCKNRTLTLLITTEGCETGSAVTLYAGNMISTGRIDIAQQIEDADLFRLNGETGAGALCVTLSGTNLLNFHITYWVIVVGVFAIAAVYTLIAGRGARQGRANMLALLMNTFCHYDFMIRQLVARDFKTKYKRSVLGMFWSFLNPLLTMAVQYVVFSTLFRSNIPNFPVYLIVGIVLFNFFSEAVSVGMTAITSNAALIKKVYMPKYIYPVSKILSSLVNFALALVPMLLVIIITGTPLRPSFLLLLFDILCLVGFVMGMALLLSTAMTFFQDMQFLWSVISMMWMYLTPLFYPESIIPVKYQTLYHMNPMYQYISFARICIIDGISPAPVFYFRCILCAAVALLLGLWVFKRNQDKFVLYL